MLLTLILDRKPLRRHVNVHGQQAQETWPPLVDGVRTARLYEVVERGFRNPAAADLGNTAPEAEDVLGGGHLRRQRGKAEIRVPDEDASPRVRRVPVECKRLEIVLPRRRPVLDAGRIAPEVARVLLQEPATIFEPGESIRERSGLGKLPVEFHDKALELLLEAGPDRRPRDVPARQVAKIFAPWRRACQEAQIEDLVEERLALSTRDRVEKLGSLCKAVFRCQVEDSLEARIRIPGQTLRNWRPVRRQHDVGRKLSAVQAPVIEARPLDVGHHLRPGRSGMIEISVTGQAAIRPNPSGEAAGLPRPGNAEAVGASRLDQALEEPDAGGGDCDREQHVAVGRGLARNCIGMPGQGGGAFPPQGAALQEVDAMSEPFGQIGIDQR